MVKHIGLATALRGTVESFHGRLFRYADICAGYAWNPLELSSGWQQGVTDVTARIQQGLAQGELINDDVRWWYDRYRGREGESDLTTVEYPGSAVIANDIPAAGYPLPRAEAMLADPADRRYTRQKGRRRPPA